MGCAGFRRSRLHYRRCCGLRCILILRSPNGTAYADYLAQLKRIAASRSQARWSEKIALGPLNTGTSGNRPGNQAHPARACRYPVEQPDSISHKGFFKPDSALRNRVERSAQVLHGVMILTEGTIYKNTLNRHQACSRANGKMVKK
jgi:hypothetical protein